MTYGDTEHPHAECRERIKELEAEAERLRARMQTAERERDAVYAALVKAGWDQLTGYPETYIGRLTAKAGGKR